MAVLAPFIPYITAAGTALSVVSGIQASNYQAKVAANNAKIAETNMAKETLAANQDMQTRDVNAMQTIADLQTSMDASGISSTSGTMMLRRRSVEELATSDREKLAEKSATNIANRKAEIAGYQADASAYSSAAAISSITGALSIPSSFLSGATMVNNFKKLQVRGSASTIGGI